MDELADESIKPVRLAWARRFWIQNRYLTDCVYEHELRAEQTGVEHSKVKPRETTVEKTSPDYGSAVNSYLQEVDSLFEKFLDWFFDPDRGMDLHNPARSEVLAGLVTRSVRSTAAVTMAPHMWTGEHGSNSLRSLFETIIILKWLTAQEDDDLFRTYQSYGWGKRKLHTKQLKHDLGSDEGNGSDFLQGLVEQMERKGLGEIGDQFQEVNLEATFSGIPLRAMADQVGELERYNRLFQTSSGVNHGEWWALEDYALDRCHNPLHRFHWIPRLQWEQPFAELRFPAILLSLLDEIIHLVIEQQALGNPSSP